MKHFALVLLVACGHHDEPAKEKPVRPLPAVEVQRAQDACDAYVAKICACPSDKAKGECKLAHAYPEALKLASDTAQNPTTERDSVARAEVNIRETAKQCIELAGKLSGCP
ncbi:MAG TPA: hypothetical protein VGC41_27715 [Kofleriaceae bacterium]